MSSSKSKTLKLVQELKRLEQDFEWYPTTDEIIDVVKADLKNLFKVSEGAELTCSILDCGAGNGKVLSALTHGNKYAIEKSSLLLAELPSDVFVVGTDFHSQTLLDKKTDILYSNPPYEEFIDWALKIIKETTAGYCYLVLPVRWKENACIIEAMRLRDAGYEIIDTKDFIAADRPARVKVDVIRITFTSQAPTFSSFDSRLMVDPFALWFSENFPVGNQQVGSATSALDERAKAYAKINEGHEIVKQEGIVKILETACQLEMAKLVETYSKLGELDMQLVKELNISVASARQALKLKISGLKTIYWNALIDRMTVITNKLTQKSRNILMATLNNNMTVDFTAANAHAVVLWAVKNANLYFDCQLVQLVEKMTYQANVVPYKSNLRTFTNEEWRYGAKPDRLDRYKLDYRVVISPIQCRNRSYERDEMIDKAQETLDDLLAVAGTIGFDVENQKRTAQLDWYDNEETFWYTDISTGEKLQLCHVRLFKNGNIHIKLAQLLICKLNCEFGRLKGWIKTAKQASEELDIEQSLAEDSFDSSVKIGSNSITKLLRIAA